MAGSLRLMFTGVLIVSVSRATSCRSAAKSAARSPAVRSVLLVMKPSNRETPSHQARW